MMLQFLGFAAVGILASFFQQYSIAFNVTAMGIRHKNVSELQGCERTHVVYPECIFIILVLYIIHLKLFEGSNLMIVQG